MVDWRSVLGRTYTEGAGRAERPDVPVIMITAYGDAETKRLSKAAGGSHFQRECIDLKFRLKVSLEKA
jgi:hypothetical protein